MPGPDVRVRGRRQSVRGGRESQSRRARRPRRSRCERAGGTLLARARSTRPSPWRTERVDDERRAPGADRRLVVVGDQRRHGGEDLVDVGALDCDELGADEVAPLRIDDENAVVELVEPERERVERDRVLAEWVDRGVAVPRPSKAIVRISSTATTLRTSESSASTRAASRSSVWRSTARNGSGW